jgi:hypothetical protein
MRISALVRCSFVLIAIAVCNAAAQDQAVASLYAGRSSELGRFQSSLQCLVLAPVPLLIDQQRETSITGLRVDWTSRGYGLWPKTLPGSAITKTSS